MKADHGETARLEDSANLTQKNLLKVLRMTLIYGCFDPTTSEQQRLRSGLRGASS